MKIDYEDLECEQMPATACNRNRGKWTTLTGNYEWYIFKGKRKYNNKSKTK